MPEFDEDNTAGYYLDSWDKYEMSLQQYTAVKGDGLVYAFESFNQDGSNNFVYVFWLIETPISRAIKIMFCPRSRLK